MTKLILIGLIIIITFYIIVTIKNNSKNCSYNKKKKRISQHKIIHGGGNNNNKLLVNPKEKGNHFNIKPHIINSQYHNDYRDIMTVINNILPVQKKVFNISNIPVKYISECDYTFMKELASDFIIMLQNHINRLPDHRNTNTGWDEAIEDPNVKSGWDKFTDKIGIPNSLYQKAAPHGNIFLIDIFNNKKQETEDQIKYISILIIGKKNVDEQLLLKISVVSNKHCNIETKQKLILEEINIVGFLSDYGEINDKNNNIDDVSLYPFNKLTKNDIITNHKILVELERVFNKKMDIVQNMMGTVEHDTGIFTNDLPNRNDLTSYKVTRNIVDDMNAMYL